MKTRVFILTTSILIICSFVFIAIDYSSFSRKKEHHNKIDTSIINHGDLILRCGTSTESFAVHLADSKAEFTHIGIVSIENNIAYVIHAVPNDNGLIKKDELSEFISKKNASKFAIYRSNYSKKLIKKVVEEAQIFINKKYTFDNAYNLSTNTELYCTELVVKAFKNVGVELHLKPKILNFMVGKHSIIFPSEFTNENEFNRIY